MVRNAWGIVALLLMGVGIWWFLRPEPGAPLMTPAGDEHEAVSDTVDLPTISVQREPVAQPFEVERGGQPALPLVPTPTNTVRGHVQDESGIPIVGATVRERFRDMESPGLRALSLLDGSFEVAVTATPALINVFHKKYQVRTVRARPGEFLTVTLSKEFRIAGIVTGTDGVPLPNIALQLELAGPLNINSGTVSRSVTTSAGTFEFRDVPGGQHRIKLADPRGIMILRKSRSGVERPWSPDRNVPYPGMEDEHLIVGQADYVALVLADAATGAQVEEAQLFGWSPGLNPMDVPVERGLENCQVFGLLASPSKLSAGAFLIVEAPGYRPVRHRPIPRPWPSDGVFATEVCSMVPDPLQVWAEVPVLVENCPAWWPRDVTLQLVLTELPSAHSDGERPLVPMREPTVRLQEGRGIVRLKVGRYTVRGRGLFGILPRELEVLPDGRTVLFIEFQRTRTPVQVTCTDDSGTCIPIRTIEVRDQDGKSDRIVFAAAGELRPLVMLPPGDFEIMALPVADAKPRRREISTRTMAGWSLQTLELPASGSVR